jgi:hypothetical protein
MFAVPKFDHFCFGLADILGVGQIPPEPSIHDLFHLRADVDADVYISILVAYRLEAGADRQADNAPGLQMIPCRCEWLSRSNLRLGA